MTSFAPTLMKRALLLTLFVLSFASTVYGLTQLKDDLLELDYGENITMNLEDFTRTTIRAYEGSKIRLNIMDLSLDTIIKSVHDDGTTLLDVSKNGAPYREWTINSENQSGVWFDHPKIKVIFFQQKAMHYSTNPQERSMQLYINLPLFGFDKGKLPEIPDAPKTEPPTTTGNVVQEEPVTPEESPSFLQKDPYLKYFFLAIGVLVVAHLTIKPKKKKRSV